jgi:hypothetical protein
MTEPRGCIAPDCDWPAVPESALCWRHKEKLQKVEEGILRETGDKIRRELRQFERLMLCEDDVTRAGQLKYPQPLTVEDIAYRMVWPEKKVRQMLRKFKDDRA